METAWDGEILGLRLALESLPLTHIVLLSDSQAAIAVVCNAAADGWARMVDLRAVVDTFGEWTTRGVLLRLRGSKLMLTY